MAAKEVIATSGSCVKVSSFDVNDARDTFVQLSCSTAAQVEDRTKTLTDLTTVPDVFVEMAVAVLSDELLFASKVGGPPSYTAGGATIYQFPYLSGGNVKVSTSSSPMKVASTATQDTFDGIYDATRIVLQEYPGSFQSSAILGKRNWMLDTETSLLPVMESLRDAAAATKEGVVLSETAPQDGDYPVGYVFGGFGTSNELSWRGAGPLAHRHYDIKGTAFDLAAHLPTSMDQLVDGDGFSISMFLRASNQTQGFAFAITDAFEDAVGGTVYTLDRMAEMIENGSPASAWFNSTYRLYASLYVSGPTKQLTFAHANPDVRGAGRVELLEWDIDRIGMGHLFNGLWHHVAVV